MMRTAFLAAIVAFVGVSAARAEPITLYGNSEQPPKAWLDRGTPKGFAVEASVEVLKRAGYDVTVSLLPFARAMQQTTEGGVMTGVFKSPEGEKLFKYSERLVDIDDDVVVVVALGKEFPFVRASDLIGKRIGLQGSFYYGEDFDAVRARVIIDADSSPNLRMKKLSAGRVDAVLINPGRAGFLDSVTQADLLAEDFKVLPTPLARLANYLIVGRNVPYVDATLARINKAIVECAKDGTLAKIMAKYSE